MDFSKWAQNQQILFVLPITISVDRGAKLFKDLPLQIKTLAPTESNSYLFITHPTVKLPDHALCHSVVAPFLNFKTVTWHNYDSTLILDLSQAIIITNSYTPSTEYESEVIVMLTDSIEQLKKALDFNQSKIFRVYIQDPKVLRYVYDTSLVYQHFEQTSSILYPGVKGLIIDDRS